MAFVHGKTATFKIHDGTSLRDLSTYVTNTEHPFDVDTSETTTYGKNSKTYLAGLKGAKFDIDFGWDSTVTTGPDAVLWAIYNAGGSVSAYQFSPNGTLVYSGAAVMTGYSVSAPVGGQVVGKASFVVTGDVARA